MSIQCVNTLNTLFFFFFFCETRTKRHKVHIVEKLFCQFAISAWTRWSFFHLTITAQLTRTYFSDMKKRSLFPVVFIYFVCIKTIQCNDGASCYTGPPEYCPKPDSPPDFCKCKNFGGQSLFCCQVQSNLDLLKHIQCSSKNLLLPIA